jgi:hypothetical protein
MMVDDGAQATALLQNDLEGHLTLLLLEAGGEGWTLCGDFAERLGAYPEIRVLHRRLVPNPGSAEIESIFTQAIQEDADITLVWAGNARGDDAEPQEDTAPYWRWPAQALAAAESVNLFEGCLVALVGEDIQQREARHLGFEDGFTASMPPDRLVLRLAREVVAHREARRRGSSPPCFL